MFTYSFIFLTQLIKFITKSLKLTERIQKELNDRDRKQPTRKNGYDLETNVNNNS